MMRKNTSSCLKILMILAMSILVVYNSFLYIAADYTDFLQGLLLSAHRMDKYERWQHNELMLMAFRTSKFILFLLLFAFFIFIYDLLFQQERRLSTAIDKNIADLSRSWKQNMHYIRQMPAAAKRGIFLIFCLQFLFQLLFIFNIPFFYDEAWCFLYFSGRGFAQTTTFYPFPNNHIFFNIIAGLFTWLPVDPEISTRLPSFFCSFISVWYMYKLCRKYFSETASLLVTILFTTAYPMVLYSVEARGYSFLICFTILMFYAAEKFIGHERSKKYQWLYFICMIAGIYTIPSFIYTIFALNIAIATCYINKADYRHLTRFVFANIIAVLAVVILYLPIIYFNGIGNLSNPNGSVRQTAGAMAGLILPHLLSTWRLLTGSEAVPPALALLLAASTLVALIRNKKDKKTLPWLTLVNLVSPVIILFLHRMLPFERTWVYLIVPLALSTGFLSQLFRRRTVAIPEPVALDQRTSPGRYYDAWQFAMLIGLLVLFYAHFKTRHPTQFPIDYSIREIFEKMGHEIDNIGSIGRTSKGMEFYVVDDLQFQCYKRNAYKKIKVEESNPSAPQQDVLVLSPGSIAQFNLSNYQFCGDLKDCCTIYARKDSLCR